MTRPMYATAVALIFAVFFGALVIIHSSGPGGARIEPNVITTVAPGWVSVNGESPVPECADGDDCTGPDYR